MLPATRWLRGVVVRLPVLLAVVMLALPGAAHANYFNGGKRNVTNRGGTVDIQVCNPAITSTGMSCAWIMCSIVGADWKYCQVGWAKACSGWQPPPPSSNAPYYIYQWSYDYYHYGTEWLNAAQTGHIADFKISEDGTNYWFLIDGKAQGSFSSSLWGATSNEILWKAETRNYSDRCAGTVSNHADFNQPQYKALNGSFVNTTVQYEDTLTNPYFENTLQPGDTSWDTWDVR